MKEIGKKLPLAFIPFANIAIQYLSMVSNRNNLKKGWLGRLALSILITFAVAVLLLSIEPYITGVINGRLWDFITFYLFSTSLCVQMVFLQRKFLQQRR